MKNKCQNSAKLIYFDTDCLSSFLLVGKEEILAKLFQGRIVIPGLVYEELNRPAIRGILKAKLDNFIKKTNIEIKEVKPNTSEEKLFSELICGKHNKIIGSGEAVCIALAKINNGILASNNLKDICVYIKKYNLEFLTTGHILVLALQNKIISLVEGEEIWQKMLKNKRKIGPSTFKEYLRNHNNPNNQIHFPCK